MIYIILYIIYSILYPIYGEGPKTWLQRPCLVISCLVQSTGFPPLLAHVVLCPGQPTISANCLGHLLPIRVHNDSVPIVFVQFSLEFIIWASSLTLIFFRLCRNHLFLTSGLSLLAKYLCKVHMEEKTWIHVLGPSPYTCMNFKLLIFLSEWLALDHAGRYQDSTDFFGLRNHPKRKRKKRFWGRINSGMTAHAILDDCWPAAQVV